MSSERDRKELAEAAWEVTTWEGNTRWRTERVLQATPEELLSWLEAALELAYRVGALTSHLRELASEDPAKKEPRN